MLLCVVNGGSVADASARRDQKLTKHHVDPSTGATMTLTGREPTMSLMPKDVTYLIPGGPHTPSTTRFWVNDGVKACMFHGKLRAAGRRMRLNPPGLCFKVSNTVPVQKVCRSIEGMLDHLFQTWVHGHPERHLFEAINGHPESVMHESVPLFYLPPPRSCLLRLAVLNGRLCGSTCVPGTALAGERGHAHANLSPSAEELGPFGGD